MFEGSEEFNDADADDDDVGGGGGGGVLARRSVSSLGIVVGSEAL